MYGLKNGVSLDRFNLEREQFSGRPQDRGGEEGDGYLETEPRVSTFCGRLGRPINQVFWGSFS